MEWKPDSLTQIIFRPSFSYSNSHSREGSTFNTLSGNRDTVNIGESDYLSDGSGYKLNARLEFSRKLNSEGRVFSGSLSGGLSDSYNKGLNYSNTEYLMMADGMDNELVDQRFRYDNKGFNYRAYLSWVEPIGHNNFIQATYSIRQNKQESLKTLIPVKKEAKITTCWTRLTAKATATTSSTSRSASPSKLSGKI